MTPPPAQPYSQEEIPRTCGWLTRAADVGEGCVTPKTLYRRLAASLEELQRLREALREREQDAERYRWLRKTDPSALAAIAWRVPAACIYPGPDSAIDMARVVSSGDQKGAEG